LFLAEQMKVRQKQRPHLPPHPVADAIHELPVLHNVINGRKLNAFLTRKS
jgi:hypothetical protein